MNRKPCDLIHRRIGSIYAELSPAKRAELLAIAFGIVLLFFAAGFVSGRITAPVSPQKMVYVKVKTAKADRKAKTQKPERHIFTSKRGKKYYLTPAGNRVYVKHENEVEGKDLK